MSSNLTEVSKYLSYVLRHEPQSIGLELDSEGWASIAALIEGARNAGRTLDTALISSVVESNDKKRFALSNDGSRIRAVQGHSTTTVDIRRDSLQPPNVLYHGTAKRFLDSILAEGLRPGSRHQVHLSADEATALSVGQRYGEPVLLKIDCLQMHAQGFAFYQAENGVWLTDHVPATFISC